MKLIQGVCVTLPVISTEKDIKLQFISYRRQIIYYMVIDERNDDKNTVHFLLAQPLLFQNNMLSLCRICEQKNRSF